VISTLISAEIPYWGQSAFRVLGVLAAVLLPAGTFVYLYLFKMMSFMQSRLGPMESGPYGSMQLFAEVAKFLQKEDLSPNGADKRIFALAPIVVVMSTFFLYVVVPFGPDAYFANIPSGIFLALAVSSVSVIGILMAGWASANKYSLMGGLRAAGQLIAYELPMILAVVGVVIQAGSINMQEIVYAQNYGDSGIFGWTGIGNPYLLTQFIGFGIFLVSMQAELTQTPFDMPVAESELVSGYMTEYSGLRFLLFFIGEFATAGAFCAIAATLFLGGWGIPIISPDNDVMNVLGPLVMFTKMVILAFFVFWARVSFPRFREDQLQSFAWKFLIPLSLANIAVTAVLKVVF
jgi:NADH-quinone oxidoreductase subunit H